jgi:hypothetical protein
VLESVAIADLAVRMMAPQNDTVNARRGWKYCAWRRGDGREFAMLCGSSTAVAMSREGKKRSVGQAVRVESRHAHGKRGRGAYERLIEKMDRAAIVSGDE